MQKKKKKSITDFNRIHFDFSQFERQRQKKQMALLKHPIGWIDRKYQRERGRERKMDNLNWLFLLFSQQKKKKIDDVTATVMNEK